MMKMTQRPILVTAYSTPDLDGVAGAIAYAEFLSMIGKPAIAAFFEETHREAKFVLDKVEIKAKSAEKIIKEVDSIILVDASELSAISPTIDPNKVIEVIDHRKVNEAEKFPNAKIQIELVGSAATLIAEKYHEAKKPISASSAMLLYSAIVSNTINFKAKVTTSRDHEMAQWLLQFFELPKNHIHDMFFHKSNLDEPLLKPFMDEIAFFSFNGKKITIVQLEIVDVDQFIKERIREITVTLETIKKENPTDFLFITLIDVEKGFNRFVVTDVESKELLEKSINAMFLKNIGKRDGIIMRKEIVPKLKDQLI